MIGSVFIHIVPIVVVTHMSPATPVAMRAVDAFIIESPFDTLKKPQKFISPEAGSAIKATIQKTGQFKPIAQGRRSELPRAGHTADKEATPPNHAKDSTRLEPTVSAGRADGVPPGTASGQPPVRPEAEDQGSKVVFASGQNSGTEKVILLGDAGSPRFIHRELPAYPFMARKLGKEGKVLLRLALDAQGKLQGIDTVEANGFGFAEAARTAIRKSTFAPAVKGGRTVSSQVLVPVRFVLNERQ